MVGSDETYAILERRPDLVDSLQKVIGIDQRRKTWSFDEVQVDSGEFGELVDAGIVERVGGEYRVADPSAVRVALEGEKPVDGRSGSSPRIPSGQFYHLAPLATAIAFVVALRLLSAPKVFRDGAVVLLGNDPYAYRYYAEMLARATQGPNNLAFLLNLPTSIANGEPLFVLVLGFLVYLMGGGQAVSGQVLAWYPIGTTAVTTFLLYLLTVVVTDDRRVGVAAVLMLAIIPAHASRTALGFGDHHAFDYLWLTLTSLALVVLAYSPSSDHQPSRRVVAGVSALCLGVAGQVLAWEAGPLLFVPVGFAVVGRALLDVRSDRSPLLNALPTLAGITLGAILVGIVHVAIGWHTTVVASAPGLLAVAALIATLVAEVGYRTEASVRSLAVSECVLLIGSIIAVRFGWPTYWSMIQANLGRLLHDRNIVETLGLFGDTLGWLLLFGLALFVAGPYLVWASLRVFRDEPDAARWLIVIIYTSYFFLLSMEQIRFTGQLALFTALFAGLGLVHLSDSIGAARPPVSFESDPRDPPFEPRSFSVNSREQVVALIAVFLLVGWLGLIQVPLVVDQTTYSSNQFKTVTAIDDYSEHRTYPRSQSYVFSTWDENRFYNYFVSRQSASYTFAKTHYQEFLTSTAPLSEAYETYRDTVRFIVINRQDQRSKKDRYDRLFVNHGSQYSDVAGSGHFRMIYVSDDGRYKAFALVNGSTVRGEAFPNTTVTLRTNVSVTGNRFRYERVVPVKRDGKFSVHVAYPGSYTVEYSNRSVTRVTVPERAVVNGTVIQVGS